MHSLQTCIRLEADFFLLFMFQILIGKGAQVDVVDNEGRSPKDFARELEEGSEMIAILEGWSLFALNNIIDFIFCPWFFCRRYLEQ